MSGELDPALLARFFQGECNAAEISQIEQWIAAVPERTAEVAALRDAWRQAAEPLRQWDTNGMWKELSRKLETGDEKSHRVRVCSSSESDERYVPFLSRPTRFAYPMLRASVVILALGAATYGGWLARAHAGAPAAELEGREVVTRAGEHADVSMSDGTHAILGPASRLKFPAVFGSGQRIVELEGQALFEVVHDVRRPFAVRAGAVIARDVGTKFTVRAYRDDSAIVVAVEDGKVGFEVKGRASRVVLAAGDVASLASNGTTSLQHVDDMAPFVAWTHGTLAFRAATLRDVARELGRQYDVEVRLSTPALGERLFTGSISQMPLSEFLENLSATVQLRYTLRDRVVVLSPR